MPVCMMFLMEIIRMVKNETITERLMANDTLPSGSPPFSRVPTGTRSSTRTHGSTPRYDLRDLGNLGRTFFLTPDTLNSYAESEAVREECDNMRLAIVQSSEE